MNGPNTALVEAVERDVKEKLSLALCVCAVGVGFVSPTISDALIILVAIL